MIKTHSVTTTTELNENMPLILDYVDLAKYLDLSGSAIWGLVNSASRVNAGVKESSYLKWSIPKKGGGERVLYAPTGALKTVQTKIRDRILDHAPKSPISVAYRKGMCPGDTARKIAGAKVILKLDIKDFFPSILWKNVVDYFQSLGYGEEVSRILAGLLCVKDKNKLFVCQGGTASPMLANRIAERLIDPVVLKELPEGWNYVRYCDNLYMWPNSDLEKTGKHREILGNIRGAIYAAGFSSHKGSVVPYYRRQKLLGLVVNEHANMPKDRYKLLRACLFNCSKSGFKSQMQVAIKLGFQHTGDPSDVGRFKLFLQGLLNYYKDYMTKHKYQQLVTWYKEACSR